MVGAELVSLTQHFEIAIGHSQELHHALTGTLADLWWIVDSQGQVIYADAATYMLLGYSPADLQGCRLFDFVHPDDGLYLEALLQRKEFVSQRRRMRLRHKQGTYRSFDYVPQDMRSAEGVNGVIFGMRDVSEWHTARQAIEASELRFRTLAEATQALIFIAELQTPARRIVYANSAMERASGLSRAQLMEKSYWDVVRAEGNSSSASLRFDEEHGTWAPFTREVLLNTCEQHQCWVELTTEMIIYNDQQALLCTGFDITERVRTQAKLAYQARVLENTSDAIISTDVQHRIVTWNQAAERIYGWRAEEVIGQPIDDLLHVRYKDSEASTAAALREIEDQGQWQGEVTQRHRSGRLLIIASSVRALHDAHGRITGFVGVNRDITAVRQVERSLRHSEERFRTLADTVPVLIWIGTGSGENTFINKAYADFFGVDTDSLQGLRWETMYHLDDLEQAQKSYAAAVRSKQVYTCEFRARRKDGVYRTMLEQAVPRLDADGNLIEYVGVVTDITEQREAERRLLNENELLEQGIAQRTAALIEANARLRWEVIERAQAEDAERQQRALAEALHSTAAAINSTLDVEEVFNRIIEEVGKVVPHDAADIVILEQGVGRLVGAKGYERVGVDPEEVKALRFRLEHIPSLAQMAREKCSLLIYDVRYSPLWTSLSDKQRIRSYLGAPIITANDEVLGFIQLNSILPGFFSVEQAGQLEAFAEHAAIAIQNARLHAQAQELAVFEERQRIARDLHDSVTQALFSASLITEALSEPVSRPSEEVRDRLSQLHRLTRGALAEMRSLLMELRPSSMLGSELHVLLRQLAEMGISRAPRANVTLKADEYASAPADVNVGIYRIAQEALNNVYKHSNATQVHIHLKGGKQAISLEIKDNGRGFEASQMLPNRMGLAIMQERARQVGGQLTITSQPHQGTSIAFLWEQRSNG